MDTNRINEINASVHQSSDLDGALSVYNLLKSNGYDIKSNMGTLMDYCKTRGLDRVKSNVELLVKYDEELAKKESVMKSFYASIYSSDKSGILDRIETLVNADTKYNIETDARYHDNSKPDNGKSIFTMRMEELKAKMGGDNISAKLEHARKSLEDNYAAFRNLTAEDLKSTKAMKLREAIDQNRYYINQLEGMSSKNSYSIDNMENINAFSADVKELYNFINSLKLNDETRKALIDEFASLRTKINDYRNYIINLQSAGKKYDALMSEMNVVKTGKATKKVEVKPAPDVPKTKPEETKSTPDTGKKDEEKKSDDTKVKPEKGADSEEKKEEPEVDFSEALTPGDVVTYNGKRSAIADVGAPTGLVTGQEYKVEKLVVFRGLTYAKLEGVDNFVDTVCLDKVMKKDKTEPEKTNDSKPSETASESKKEETKVETPSEKKDEPEEKPASSSEDEKGNKKSHDYKVMRIREVVGNLLPISFWTAAIIGIGLSSSIAINGVLLSGALASMAIGYCISHNIKLPKFTKLKEKFSKKLHVKSEKENAQEEQEKENTPAEKDNNTPVESEKEDSSKPNMTEEEARDAKIVVSEIESAEKDLLIDNLKTGKMTEEELRDLAKEYVDAGKMKPEVLESDRETLNNAVIDLIINEFKVPEKTNESARTM